MPGTELAYFVLIEIRVKGRLVGAGVRRVDFLQEEGLEAGPVGSRVPLPPAVQWEDQGEGRGETVHREGETA